jgi:CHAP domain
MTLTDALARIDQIRAMTDPQAAAAASAPPSVASTAATAASFQQLLAATADDNDDGADPAMPGLSSSARLDQALTSGASGATAALSAATALGGSAALGGTTALGGTAAPGASTVGQRMVQVAEGEVGQAEHPPGSNDSPRIAQYRSATSGSGIGPWCAYFTSWVGKQAGAPVGEAGQGFGSVQAVTDWAQRTGRWLPQGTATPQPGDLVVWGSSHIGIVESVDPNGSIHTIEGNSSDAVSRRTYGPDGGGASGFVRVG